MSAPPRPGGVAPHVLVDDVEHPVISDADRHHLTKVRRLRNGDALTITDGRGRWRWCAWGEVVETTSEVVVDPEPAPRLLVGFALVKGEKPELVVQKLTEIGIDDIVPFEAERSIVRWDADKAARNIERLRSVAREAVQQSRRTWMPTVHPVRTFAECAAMGARRADLGGAVIDDACTAVLIGPEGGWSDAERSAVPAVGLGANVLRAETAAIVAGALLVATRGH